MTSIYTYASQVDAHRGGMYRDRVLTGKQPPWFPAEMTGCSRFLRRISCDVFPAYRLQMPHWDLGTSLGRPDQDRSDPKLCGICRILNLLHNFVCQGDMEMVGINLLLLHQRSGKQPFCLRWEFWARVNTWTDHSVFLSIGHGSG